MWNNKKAGIYVWHGLPVVALIVWGALCLSDQLWYDEAFSAGMVMQPWGKLIYITAIDDHSPFYYAVLKMFYLLCGTIGYLFGTEVHLHILKVFSLIFMMGYIFLGKYYVAKLFDRTISGWFMFFSVLSPLMSVQAGNVRMYAMALFFLTLTGLLAYDIYREESRRKWILFVCSSICVVYCHTFAMIQTVWLYLLFMGALMYTRQTSKLKKFFASGIVVSLVYSPWLVVTFRQMQLRMRYDVGSATELAGLKEVRDYFLEWFSALETPVEAVMWIEIAIAALMTAAALKWMQEHKNYAPVFGAGAFVLTAVTGFLISACLNNCFLGRYAFPGFGLLMLLFAVGMSELLHEKMHFAGKVLGGASVIALMLCFVVQYRLELELEYDGGLDRFEAFWQENVSPEDACIGAQGHTVFLGVYHPEQAYFLDGYVPADLSFPNLESCYDISDLVRERGRAWYIDFVGGTPKVDEEILVERALEFHYMYYDFVIYSLSVSED